MAPLWVPGTCCGHFHVPRLEEQQSGAFSQTRQRAAGSLPHLGTCSSSKARKLALEGREMEPAGGRLQSLFGDLCSQR